LINIVYEPPLDWTVLTLTI